MSDRRIGNSGCAAYACFALFSGLAFPWRLSQESSLNVPLGTGATSDRVLNFVAHHIISLVAFYVNFVYLLFLRVTANAGDIF